MARSSYQKLKILYILDILKSYSDEEHPLNAKDIAEHLEKRNICAERKSVYDDIEKLEFYGCDIIKTDYPKVGWFLASREFEVPEIYLLSDAVRSARFISAKKSRELLAKLNGMLSCYQAKRRASSVFFSDCEKSGNEEIYYSIDTVNRAIEEKKQIKIKYSSRKLDANRNVRSVLKEMTLNPYALCWQDDHYYLIGNYVKYDNLIHLRLDRIRAAEVTDTPVRHFSEVSPYKDFFNTADYTQKLFGMYSGEVCAVDLYCSKDITEQVFDRFGEGLFIKEESENAFKITVNVVLSDALVTWIINYGDKLRVEKPQRLQQMVVDRARAVLNEYSEVELCE